MRHLETHGTKSGPLVKVLSGLEDEEAKKVRAFDPVDIIRNLREDGMKKIACKNEITLYILPTVPKRIQ
jgi:hypothetical protein